MAPAPTSPSSADASRAGRAAAMPAAQRRAAIVSATRPLLVEHGERVTTRQIAEAAGIAEGTIFRVFADKDEVLTATLDAALDPSPMEAAIEHIDTELSFEAQVVAAVDIVQRRIVDVWLLVSNLGPRFHGRIARPSVDSDALTALFDRHRDQLRLDPTAVARMLRGLTLSMSHPMLAGDPASPAEIASVLLHGIERP